MGNIVTPPRLITYKLAPKIELNREKGENERKSSKISLLK
jgi:hypothetical protein